jgi:hypothetical protein
MTDMLFSPADDNFHTAPAAELWFTETCWFSFNIPERKMGGWLYAWARPNMQNCGGGVFVWDPQGAEPWNVPYYKYQYCQPLPPQADLRDFTFTEGYRVKMLEPLTRYHLSYRDRELIEVDLVWEALFPPHGFKSGEPPFHAQPHLDQMGHVTGTLTLHGEVIAVDCYSIRDRSWGPRLDHRGNRIGYPFGCARDIAFCLFALPNKDYSDADERINHGFLWQDGVKANLSGGLRQVQRCPAHNWPVSMQIDSVDDQGRPLRAQGIVESRIVLPVPRGICINSSVRWEVNGKIAYGEDQDVWRYDQWYAARKQLGQL